MERWMPIVGYRGLYEISSVGRVRSTRSSAFLKHRLKGPKRRKYPRVVLCMDGKQREFAVNRLVLDAFRGPCPKDKTDACHKNDDQFDNRLGNLYWGTRTENLADAKRNGRLRPCIGSQVGVAKLSDAAVKKLMKLRSAGRRQVDVAAILGVSQATVSAVENGIVWCQVTGMARKQPYGQRRRSARRAELLRRTGLLK